MTRQSRLDIRRLELEIKRLKDKNYKLEGDYAVLQISVTLDQTLEETVNLEQNLMAERFVQVMRMFEKQALDEIEKKSELLDIIKKQKDYISQLDEEIGFKKENAERLASLGSDKIIAEYETLMDGMQGEYEQTLKDKNARIAELEDQLAKKDSERSGRS
jgi:hypothetical protein